MSESDAYQRQLQQLFNLHDSGLDQAFIDALPVFIYKDIIGLKEPFDCAFDDQRDEDLVLGIGSTNKDMESHIMYGKRVFSVRLGKFKSSNNSEGIEKSEGESNLQVTLKGSKGDSMRQLKGIREVCDGSFSNDGDVEGKKINIARKGESFSVSKIWQWSKKDSKIPSSSDTHFHNCVANESLHRMNKARGN
ncbi:hypothetical protein TSUD_220660 [Trifolium subterraneum]|uniref:RING-type E3 ubiquitin transferase n=1 Tax=Trifolium subterraneum TaxID=3900 RepID=A0A2Z6P3F5_TRISU|nr:hypothetical protein TSUD_220660 [Trifolium subterraneum]